MGALALTATDLEHLGDEPRIVDLRIGDVLGYADSKKVRSIIRRHMPELLEHGVLTQSESKPPFKRQTDAKSVGGRPERCFLLNEAQATLITMFSRTERAKEARRQIVTVFLAWRHQRLVPSQVPAAPAVPTDDRLEALARRLELMERTMAAGPMRRSDEHAFSLPYLPGDKVRRRMPDFWSDLPVRNLLTRHHRQMTVREVQGVLADEIGRVPSKSAIARYWLWLDDVVGRQFGGVQ